MGRINKVVSIAQLEPKPPGDDPYEREIPTNPGPIIEEGKSV